MTGGYDGRISRKCVESGECQAGTCASPRSYVAGCGGCCSCLGGCELGAAEQRDEEREVGQ